MKTKKTIKQKDDKDNQIIENNIKINIDLNDLNKKPEKKKRKRAVKKKLVNPEDFLKSGANTEPSRMAPIPLGSREMPSLDSPYNPNTNANTLINTALQNLFSNRQNLFNNNPLQPASLPTQNAPQNAGIPQPVTIAPTVSQPLLIGPAGFAPVPSQQPPQTPAQAPNLSTYTAFGSVPPSPAMSSVSFN